MSSQFRPLLGARVESISQVKFPVFASLKLDGIRAIKWGPELLSRTLKTIPNRFLAARLREVPSGWDGELIAGEPNSPNVYNLSESLVMSRNKDASSIRFFVFDNHESQGDFTTRLESISDLPPSVIKLDQVLIDRADDLLAFEENALASGYEGVVLRHPGGRYKFGRSTIREQYLLKLKRFLDDEAVIIGFEELERNFNEATLDERGYTKRSSHKDNKVGAGMLGALRVDWKGKELKLGSGFTEQQRKEIWSARDRYLGRKARFKYFPIGIKDLPRQPIFTGFRSDLDL